MKIYATGLSGLVGSRIYELLKNSFEFIDLSRSKGCDITNLSDLQTHLSNLSSQDFVLHFAARTDVDGAEAERPEGEKSNSWLVNVEATKNIAEITFKKHAHLIHISTDYVFNSEQGPYREDDQVATSPENIGWYAWTKVQAEKAIKEIGTINTIIRISSPYRAYFPEKTDFARDIITRFEENRLYPLFTDRQMNPLFIDDLATLIKIIIQQKPQGVYHFGCKYPTSPYDFGAYLLVKYFNKVPIIEKSLQSDFLKRPNSTPRAINSGFIVEKVKELGITPKTYQENINEFIVQIKHAKDK